MSPALAIAPKQPTRTGWALLLTSVAFFMVTLDSLVVDPLPAIHRELGGQVSTLEWAVSAYLLVFAAGIITTASIGERFGRRRVCVAGLALFSLASAACALAPSTTLLIAARAMQGLGAAIVTPLSLTILTTAYGPERRGRVIGIWGSIAGLAVAAGGSPVNSAHPPHLYRRTLPTTRSHDDVRPDPRHRSDRLWCARRPYCAPADPADAHPPHIV